MQRRQNSSRGDIFFFFVQTVQTHRNSSIDYVFSSCKLCKHVETAPVAIKNHLTMYFLRANCANTSKQFIWLCIFLRANCAKTSKQLIWLCIFFVQTVQTHRNSSSDYVFSSCKLCKDDKTAPLAIYFFSFLQTVQTHRNSSSDNVFSSCKLCKHVKTAHLTMYFLRANCANTSKQLIWQCIFFVQTRRNSSSNYVFSSCKLSKDIKTAPVAINFFFRANCANSPPSHLAMYFLRATCTNTSKQLPWLYIFSSCKMCKHVETAHLAMYFSSCKLCGLRRFVGHICVSHFRANNRQRDCCARYS